MSEKNSSKSLYLVIGVLLAVVIGLGAMYLTEKSDEPTLSIDVNEDGIDINTSD